MDLNGRPSQPLRASAHVFSSVLRFCAATTVLCSAFALGPSASRAQSSADQNQGDQQNQSVADAARQERARKHEQQKSAKHVYTNEDLKRSHILTPEDQVKVEARKNECARKNQCGPAPAQNAPAAVDADAKSAQPSLGEVARQLRQQKELDALKPKQSEPFHLSIGTPVLASPVLPERSPIQPPVPPVLRPGVPKSETHGNVFRRDPFAPVPPRPRVSLDGAARFHPSPRSTTHIVAPVAPKIPTRGVPPVLSVTPRQPAQPAPDSRPAKAPSPRVSTGPVRPKVSANSSRMTSPVTAAKIFSEPAPVMSLELPSPQPSTPADAVKPVQPESPIALQPPPSASVLTIRVEPGDSLWKLARRHLGHGARWSQLLAANPSITDANRLHVGVALVLPVTANSSVPAGPIVKANGQNGGTTIQVRKGDTLWGLAKSNLGRGAAWSCLAASNPSISNPDRILEGQELLLPSTCNPPAHE